MEILTLWFICLDEDSVVRRPLSSCIGEYSFVNGKIDTQIWGMKRHHFLNMLGMESNF